MTRAGTRSMDRMKITNKVARLLLSLFLLVGPTLAEARQAAQQQFDESADATYRQLNGIDRALHREIRQSFGPRRDRIPLEQVRAKYDLSPRSDACQLVYFGQASVRPDFSRSGLFKGATLDEIVAKLPSGELTPGDVPIGFIWVNGKRVTVNSRSLTPLYKAGLRPTKLTDRTGSLPAQGYDTLENILMRLEGMGGIPSTEMLVRTKGSGRDGLPKQASDWGAPIGEYVNMPYDLLTEAKRCSR